MVSSSSLFLGLDLGTSGCRGIVINTHEDQVAEARVQFDSFTDQQGHHQQQDNKHKGQGTQGYDGFHRIDTSGKDHHQPQGAENNSPDELDPDAGIRVAAGGKHPQNKGGADDASDHKKKRSKNHPGGRQLR